MFRVLLVIVGFVAAAIWIEARWSSEQRELTLRLREPSELAEVVRVRSRELGQRVAREVRERLADVAAAPSGPPAGPEDAPEAADRAPDRPAERERRTGTEEQISSSDQKRLDRVIAEKTRER